ALYVLARRQPLPAGPARRGAGDLRASPLAAERPGADLGGVRPVDEAAARKFPAGVVARGPAEYRLQPERRRGDVAAPPGTGPPRTPGLGEAAERSADARALR